MTMTRILAVYRTCPVMLVVETEGREILELSLNELAGVYELLPPRLWQALVDQYRIFQVRRSPPLTASHFRLPPER